MKIKLLTLWMCLALLLTGCGKETVHRDGSTLTGGDGVLNENQSSGESAGGSREETALTPDASGGSDTAPEDSTDLGGDDKTFGEDLESAGIYDNYFEGDSTDITVECVSGTPNAYTLEGSTLTFTAIEAGSSTYSSKQFTYT